MSKLRLTYFNILVSVGADIFLILTAILFLPYRLFVYIYARVFKPHLKLIATGNTHMFCQPHIGNSFFPNTITVVITIGGNIQVEAFRKLFNQKILQYRHKDGTHSFRRFQNTIESFMGYWFWSDEINFNLNQHIKLYKSEKVYSSCDQNFLKEILSQLSKRPWNKNQSPWEITVIPCKNSQTLLIVRWHHCLADGLSMAKVVKGFMESETSHTNRDSKTLKDFETSPKLTINIPRDTAKARNWSFETLPKGKETLHQGSSFTKSFPLEAIKGIMSRHNVSFQAVLSTVTSSAMQRGLEKCGHPVPKCVLCISPLKSPKHPGHMTNEFLPVFLPMVVECSSLKSRLKKSGDFSKDVKNSSFPSGQYYRVHVASVLPTLLRNLFLAKILEKGTIILSNFPSVGKMSLLGNEVVDITGVLEAIPGTVDVTVLTTGYLNHIRFGVTVINNVMSDSEQLCNYLESEMEKLFNLE